MCRGRVIARDVSYDTTNGAVFSVLIPEHIRNRNVKKWRISEFYTTTTSKFAAIVYIPELPTNGYSGLNTGLPAAGGQLIIPTNAVGVGGFSEKPWHDFVSTSGVLPVHINVNLYWGALATFSAPSVDATAVGPMVMRFEFLIDDGEAGQNPSCNCH